MNKPLCIILNLAPHYRKAIYQAIDKEFECDWYAGDKIDDIKTLSNNELQRYKTVKNIFLIKHNYIQTAILPLLFKKKYSTYLVTGDIRNITLWLFLLCSKLLRKKRVYLWTHGDNGKGNIITRAIKKCFFSLGDGIFLYGDYTKNHMVSAGYDEQKLFVIHNSLDYDTHLKCRRSLHTSDIYRHHFHNNNYNLIFIGRLTAIKRLDLILEAIYLLSQQGEEYNITFIGEGTEYNTLQKKVQQLQLQDKVWFYGACYDDDKTAELIYNADLCVSPGNVGLTAIHSMTFGTPIATHNNFTMQMPEFEAIKEGVTGTYFKYNNAASIAETIRMWFDDNGSKREEIRTHCMQEIDANWTPEYQISVLKKHIVL